MATSLNQRPSPESDSGSGQTSGGINRVRVRKKSARGLPQSYFIVLLQNERWFRWGLASTSILFFLAVFVAFSRWTTSPQGVVPVIKVRFLNLIYSWSFEHSARQAVAAGRLDLAVRGWEESIARNPANLRALRGLIRTVNDLPQVNQPTVNLTIRVANQLLAMNFTNANDLELVADFYGKYDVTDYAVWRLNGTNVPTTPAISLALVKSLYELGMVSRLQEVWKSRGSSLEQNPEAQLYRLATTAAWGGETERVQAREGLNDAVKAYPAGSPLNLTALRLCLRTAYIRVNRLELEKRLEQLADLHADRLNDHLYHFLLLNATGFQDEALRLAKENIQVPKTIEEAELQIEVWSRLNMGTEAARFCREQMVNFGYPPRLCVSLIPLLFYSGAWDEFRPLAVSIRRDSQASAIFGDYSYFLEGLAELGLGNRKGASEFFDKFASKPGSDSRLIMSAASLLNRNGFGFVAAKLLRSTEPTQGDAQAYWREVQAAAYISRDHNLLFSARERLYRKNPKDPVVANNYAAVLLMLREQTAEAVRITLEVRNALPDSFSALVNHAVALCQLGRAAEADQMLKGLDPRDYKADDRNSLIFARVQCHVALGRIDDARNLAQQVDRSFLFPPQISWLNSVLSPSAGSESPKN